MLTRLATVAGLVSVLVAPQPGLGAAAGSSPEQAPVPAFQVPRGFVVEKVAGPPLVRYPLFAAFDDLGRLYVAEGTGTNLAGDELTRRKLGRILLLEDTNGDGKFDTSKVFADRLVFPQGVLWHQGAVYVASHPSWWRLEDPLGMGVATRRVELATGFGFNGNGCDIHGPFLGPDGRLYWTDGRHGYKVKTREGPMLEGFASRIWRCRTDGTGIERLCGGGFDNPVEIAFTAEGEAIGTMDQGPGDCLLHYVEGGVYPMEHPCLKEFVRTGPLLGAVRQYSPVLPAALCGLTRYRSRSLGDEYRNCLFSTHYMLHKIVRHTLVRDGSTFRAEDHDFLTSTSHDLRLTDVIEDADGSLLFIDMGAWFTYGFPGNPLPKPAALGAIYRIRRSDAPPVADPWGKTLNLGRRSAEELASFLQDPRPRVRDQAIECLANHGPSAIPILMAVVRTPGRWTVQARRNAVWTLCRIDSPAVRPVLRSALADKDPSVRLAAAHAAGLERDSEAIAALGALVETDQPALRRKAAESLGRIGRPDAVPSLLEGLRQGGDRFLEHALLYALIRINDRKAILPALSDPDARVRRAGLVALDQMRDGKLSPKQVAPFLEAREPDLQRAALEVISRRPAWSNLAEGFLRKRLASTDLPAEQKQSFTELLLAGGGEAGIQRVVADALADPRTPVTTRLLLLDVVGQGRLDPLPAIWLEALGQALMDANVSVRRAAVAAMKMRNVSRFDRQLVELSRQPVLPTDLRVAALECLGNRRQLDEEAFELLAGQLSDTAEPLLRLAAARALGTGALTNEQLIRLAGALAKTSTIVLRLLLPAFAKADNPTVGAALVAALQHSVSVEALSVVELDRVLRGYPAEVRNQARKLRAKLAARQKDQAAYLARLAGELDRLRGDPDAGQEIFLSPKVGCYSCHRAAGRGGDIGPDLSRIGRLRTRAELLESIVFPNLTIAPEYRPIQVITTAGRVVTGLVTRDTPEAIYLRTTELAEVRIARKDVEAMTPSAVSLMPEGLEKTMTRQQLGDLLEFLCRQR